jgi:2-phosphosulfolactate phosphatase
MRIDAALSPAESREAEVVILVDTLRATTTLTTMVERGMDLILVAGSTDEARKLKERHPEFLLCGEEKGIRPDGFDFGNSPAEFAELSPLGENRAILSTSNGTPLITRYRNANLPLIGCLRNAAAVAEAAAGPDRPVVVACAGYSASGEESLEDSFTARAIVHELIRDREGFELTAEANSAFDLFAGYGGDARRVLAESRHARDLVDLGFQADIAYAAEMNCSLAVPLLDPAEDELRIVPLRR